MEVLVNVTLDETEMLHLKCDKCGFDESLEDRDALFSELPNHLIKDVPCIKTNGN